MRKSTRFLMFTVISFLLIGTILVFYKYYCITNDQIGTKSKSPNRMIRNGPVINGVISTETIGDVVIRIEASRLWFKKSKTFGFDNALLKKIAADDFRLTIFKREKKILSLSKDQVEMPLSQEVIKIRGPIISVPADIDKPDAIKIDKKKLLIHFYKKRSETTWDVSSVMPTK